MKKNNFLARVEREKEKALAMRTRFTLQMSLDAALIAAAEVFSLGEKRAKVFMDKFAEVYNDMARMALGGRGNRQGDRLHKGESGREAAGNLREVFLPVGGTVSVRGKSIRKIHLMHRFFGVCEGKTCGDCRSLISVRLGYKCLSKCVVYGVSSSVATDWAKRWTACGMFNQEYTGTEIKRIVRRGSGEKEPEEPMEGQMNYWRRNDN